jgi:holin-like protein
MAERLRKQYHPRRGKPHDDSDTGAAATNQRMRGRWPTPAYSPAFRASRRRKPPAACRAAGGNCRTSLRITRPACVQGRVAMSPLLAGFTWLLVFQCAGEALVRLAGLPIPGPVAGLAVLFAVLLLLPEVPAALSQAAEGLARHLSLLFVPAGVGVMSYLGRIADEWLPIAAALIVSTLLAIAATAATFAWLVRRTQSGPLPETEIEP